MLHKPVGLVTTPVGTPAVAGIEIKLFVLLVDVLFIPQLTLPLLDVDRAVDVILPQDIELVPQDIVPVVTNELHVIDVNCADSVDTIGTLGTIPTAESIVNLVETDPTSELDAVDDELDVMILN